MKRREVPDGAYSYADAYRRRKKWLTALVCMAAVVVFCVVYALVMPAAALEGDTFCGETEHSHTEECYESVLICGLEEAEEHIHDESCYGQILICEVSEHLHTDVCYVNPEENSEAETAEIETDESAQGEESEAETDESAEVEEPETETDESAQGEESEAETDESAEEPEIEAASLPEGAQVPEGYTEQYTVRDEENGFVVTVYAPEGVIPEGLSLSASLLGEDDEAYAAAAEALLSETEGEAEADESGYGFAALDIHFEDAEGNETEPNGDVYVVIDAEGLLPEEADPESVTVQHHAESDGTVSVETVADAADATEGVVAVSDERSVQAAFSVESFSSFTISWSAGGSTYFTVTIYYVDENGNELNVSTSNESINIGNNQTGSRTYTFSNYEVDIDGYTYVEARRDSLTGSVVTSMTFSQSRSGGMGNNYTRTLTFYNGTARVGTELTYSNSTQTASVYLVYSQDDDGGGSGGSSGSGGSGGTDADTDASVSTTKTAVLNEDDGTYDLTLSISGELGSMGVVTAVDVLFIADVSRSMDGTPLTNLKNAMNTLVDSLEGKSYIDARYSIVTFASIGSEHLGWTAVSGSNVSNSINSLSLSTGTNYQAGLELGVTQLASVREDAVTVVIFLSDGEPNRYGSGSSLSGINSNGWTSTLNTAGQINASYFYAIGIGSGFSQYLDDSTGVTSAVNATIYKEFLQADSSGTDLTTLFEGITQQFTSFSAKAVTISDQLSEYADMVLGDDGNPQFNIAVSNGNGTTWESNGANTLGFYAADGTTWVTVTAAYDTTNKTITLTFDENYELEEGYTYSVSTVIKPSDAAVAAGNGNEAAQSKPDSGTGTHAENGELGFYSNGVAVVEFTANGVKNEVAFPKPVIRVTKGSLTIYKTNEDGSLGLDGAKFRLYYEDEDGTKHYYLAVSDTEGNVTVEWVSEEDRDIDDDESFLVESVNDGYLSFLALDINKTYYLVEIEAPDGYQLLEYPLRIYWNVYDGTINAYMGETALMDIDQDSNTITVTNITGQRLPETGGAGTTLLTIGGVMMISFAVSGGYVLWRRHRLCGSPSYGR